MSDDVMVCAHCPTTCRYCGSWLLYAVDHHDCARDACTRDPDDCPLLAYVAIGTCSGCSYGVSVVRSTGEILLERLRHLKVDYEHGFFTLRVGKRAKLFRRRFEKRPADLLRLLRLGPMS